MKKIFRRLLLFNKYEIQTKLSKQEIRRRIESFIESERRDYYGKATEIGFFVGLRFIRYHDFVRINNSFAPIAKGEITESGEVTTVSITTRMHLLTLILFAPIYVITLLTVVLFPLVHLLLHFAFAAPQKRLEEEIENLLVDR